MCEKTSGLPARSTEARRLLGLFEVIHALIFYRDREAGIISESLFSLVKLVAALIFVFLNLVGL